MTPETTPERRMFCLRCHHDLGVVGKPGGVSSDICPECGADFDAADPSTYAGRPRSPLELLLLRRVAPALMIGLLLFTLLWYAWIPRPVAMFGRHGPAPESIRRPERSTLWLWGDSLYGPETVRTASSISEAWVWNNRVRSVKSFDQSSGEMDWEVLWKPGGPGGQEGVWTMRVHRPWSLNFDLLEGFRATRERILGIVVGEHDSSVTVEPFVVSGTEADILSAYVRATGVSVRPIRSEADQIAFWVFDEQLDRLVQVDEAELIRRGIEPLDRTAPSLFGFSESP